MVASGISRRSVTTLYSGTPATSGGVTYRSVSVTTVIPSSFFAFPFPVFTAPAFFAVSAVSPMSHAEQSAGGFVIFRRRTNHHLRPRVEGVTTTREDQMEREIKS